MAVHADNNGESKKSDPETDPKSITGNYFLHLLRVHDQERIIEKKEEGGSVKRPSI